jgi:hypothetical protein
MYTRPTQTATLLAIAAVAAGLLAASCADDAEALSKQQFVEQANAICAASNERIDPLFERVYADLDDVDLNDPDSRFVIFRRFDEAMGEVLPIIEQQLDDIGVLQPPAEDEELIDTLLADQEAAIAEFAGLLEAAADGDESALAALETDEDPFDEIDRRARDYGLDVCGEAD